jgi:flagellar basal body-associated protein FliL
MSSHEAESKPAPKPWERKPAWVLAAGRIWQALVGRGSERRPMALLFVLSLIGVLAVGAISTRRYLKYRKIAQERAARMKKKEPCVEMSCAFSAMEELAKKNAALAEIKASTVNLGEFEIGLVGLGDGRPGRSGMRLELEVAIEFDSGDTGRWVSSSLAPARSELVGSVGSLTGLTREDLMTPEGKSKVRERIRERMEKWLPSGKVKGIYFSKFLLQ